MPSTRTGSSSSSGARSVISWAGDMSPPVPEACFVLPISSLLLASAAGLVAVEAAMALEDSTIPMVGESLKESGGLLLTKKI